MKLSFGVLDSEFKNPGVTFLPPLKEFHPRNSSVQGKIITKHIKTNSPKMWHKHILKVKYIFQIDKRCIVFCLLLTSALI